MRDAPLTVLLVEDNPGDARLLSVGLVEEAGDAFRLEWVEDLATALERVASELVDVVVLDLNLPDSSGFETFARMQAAAPELPILVLTGLEDESVGLKAIQQGAQDYISKSSVSGSSVARALRYSMERHRSRMRELRSARSARRGKVVGFIGAKGGVGTTTVVLNTAALLLKNSRRPVIAAELRSDYGSFAAHLRETPAYTLGGLLKMDLAMLTESLLDKFLHRSRVGFDVLFSSQTPEDFCVLQADDVRYLVDRLALRSAFTMLDLPSLYSPVTETVLRGCDLTVLVTERDPSSLAAAKVALRFLARTEGEFPEIGLVIVNRSLMVEGASPTQIEAELGCPLLGVVPPAPDISAGAQRLGTPMAFHRPLSAQASMLNAISEKIYARLEAGATGTLKPVLLS